MNNEEISSEEITTVEVTAASSVTETILAKTQATYMLDSILTVLAKCMEIPNMKKQNYIDLKKAIDYKFILEKYITSIPEPSEPEQCRCCQNDSNPEPPNTSDWEKRFEELERMIVSSCSQRSYSSVTQQNVQLSAPQQQIPIPLQAVPTLTLKVDCLDDANSRAEGLKQRIIDSIPVRDGDGGVNRMRLLGKKSLLIVARDEEAKTYLEHQIQDKHKDVCRIGQPFYKMPAVRFEGLHNNDSGEELKEHLCKKFPEHSEKIKVILLHKLRSGDEQAAIVRVPKEVYKELMMMPVLYFKYSRLRIKKHTHVTMCYRCQMYGHISTNCSNKEHCSSCAGEHSHKQCPHRSEPEHIVCAVCQQYNTAGKSNKPVNHRCHSTDCPHHKKALHNTEAQTEYQCSV
ncbi:hypothetical protein HDE_02085 [Halotydeus destructor]|nr:hypothetical protein HDE_02085 [Halotydeus destructor]